MNAIIIGVSILIVVVSGLLGICVLLDIGDDLCPDDSDKWGKP